MIIGAPAKINLNLHITGRRDDGYHLLDSLMVFTDWGDEISITDADEFGLSVDGPYTGIFTPDLLSTARHSPNLIIRAVYVMADHGGFEPKFHVHVTKNIPAGAGLGGGSSNAAAIMHALNTMWDMNLSLDDLCVLGLRLGAELPVCLHAQPVRVRGIGEVIEPVTVPPFFLVITWPDQGLLTKDVFDIYRGDHERMAKAERSSKTFHHLPLKVCPAFLRDRDGFIKYLKSTTNDLTSAAMSLCPEISKIIVMLDQSKGCALARMSGSGSACFGVFESRDVAEAAAKTFKNAIVTKIS